jgi:hypothetical protein
LIVAADGHRKAETNEEREQCQCGGQNKIEALLLAFLVLALTFLALYLAALSGAFISKRRAALLFRGFQFVVRSVRLALPEILDASA